MKNILLLAHLSMLRCLFAANVSQSGRELFEEFNDFSPSFLECNANFLCDFANILKITHLCLFFFLSYDV